MKWSKGRAAVAALSDQFVFGDPETRARALGLDTNRYPVGFCIGLRPVADGPIDDDLHCQIQILVQRSSGDPKVGDIQPRILKALVAAGVTEERDYGLKSAPRFAPLLGADPSLASNLCNAHNPASPGVKIGAAGCKPGALGFFARDKSSNHYAVTAAHVVTDFFRANGPLPVWHPEVGHAGAYQLGFPHNPPDPDPVSRVVHDAAAIPLGRNLQFAPSRLLGTNVTLQAGGVLNPAGEPAIAKLGPRTGLTTGAFVMFETNAHLHDDAQNPTVSWVIEDAMLVRGDRRAFAARGDSGAPAFTPDGGLVGIVVGGANNVSNSGDTLLISVRDCLEGLKPSLDLTPEFAS
jgi:hypothetical protein